MYDIEQIESIFDRLAQKVKTELDTQYELKRIKGTEYAEVYEKLINAILLASFDAPLKEKEMEYKDAQIEIAKADLDIREQELALKEKELELKEKQLELMDVEIDLKKKEIELKDKQIEMMDIDIQLKEKDLDIKEQELEIKKNQVLLQAEQVLLTRRQIKGFDEKSQKDVFKIIMDAWAMMFSSGLLVDDDGNAAVPEIINNDKTTCIFDALMRESGAFKCDSDDDNDDKDRTDE